MARSRSRSASARRPVKRSGKSKTKQQTNKRSNGDKPCYERSYSKTSYIEGSGAEARGYETVSVYEEKDGKTIVNYKRTRSIGGGSRSSSTARGARGTRSATGRATTKTTTRSKGKTTGRTKATARGRPNSRGISGPVSSHRRAGTKVTAVKHRGRGTSSGTKRCGTKKSRSRSRSRSSSRATISRGRCAPKKRPLHAYNIFIMENISRLGQVSMQVKISTLAQEWKSMSDKEKRKYQQKADERNKNRKNRKN